jgi:surface antigen
MCVFWRNLIEVGAKRLKKQCKDRAEFTERCIGLIMTTKASTNRVSRSARDSTFRAVKRAISHGAVGVAVISAGFLSAVLMQSPSIANAATTVTTPTQYVSPSQAWDSSACEAAYSSPGFCEWTVPFDSTIGHETGNTNTPSQTNTAYYYNDCTYWAITNWPGLIDDTDVVTSDPGQWPQYASEYNIKTSSTPAVGDLAFWSAGQDGSGSNGHVAYVVAVNPSVNGTVEDGAIVVSETGMGLNGSFIEQGDYRVIPASQVSGLTYMVSNNAVTQTTTGGSSGGTTSGGTTSGSTGAGSTQSGGNSGSSGGGNGTSTKTSTTVPNPGLGIKLGVTKKLSKRQVRVGIVASVRSGVTKRNGKITVTATNGTKHVTAVVSKSNWTAFTLTLGAKGTWRVSAHFTTSNKAQYTNQTTKVVALKVLDL